MRDEGYEWRQTRTDNFGVGRNNLLTVGIPDEGLRN